MPELNTYQNLSNGATMPVIGLGCGAIKMEEVEPALRAALDAGYRHFDCALLYGNEACIGQALENIFNDGVYTREDIFITTKLPMIGNRPERVENFLNQSLRNLRTSYVDLYLIHFPVGFKYEDEETFFPKKDGQINLDFEFSNLTSLWKAMEKQVTAGKAKAVGLSNFSVKQIATILEDAEIRPANLQIELHAYFQQKELRAFCQNNGIVVSAYAPLGSPGRREAFKPKGVPEVLTDPVVVNIAKKHGKTSAQVLLKFLVGQQIVVIPKSSSASRIQENIDIFDFELTDEDQRELALLDREEEGRSFDYLQIFVGLENHPNNPMPLQ